MSKHELLEIMITVTQFFEKFNFTEEKIEEWYPYMKDLNADDVKEKLALYVKKNKYPPTLSDLLIFTPPKNEFINKVKKWEERSHWTST